MFIGSSLKMYFSHARTVQWMGAVAEQVKNHPALDAGIRPFMIPQYPSIAACVAIGTGAGIAVGAQDLAAEDAGPYTGEVSGAVLAEVGCRYVEVGHAERRQLFGETDDVVAAKVFAAQRNGLVPLLCIGEQLPGDTVAAIAECRRQIDAGLTDARRAELTGPVIIAYEPLWAIGAPQPASTEHIRAVCGSLQEFASKMPESASLIYGGSAQPGMLTAVADVVDGLFLGRFAHDPRAFVQILDEALALV
ncbi:triosephosphate isomerase [Microbacterium sp. W4I4]|uniref:triose-phosphate isomerase family protein n=1 Tax=Microbacterium sp. W4I4 TaxID=3042295 RepID=UPI0027858CED|nr:triose-phosphate isomerase family protein [Microbacterium sp. W4I4]MDQ0615353.1 triosephosphate isomerase [Microbacterium sp. W4I4]